MSKKFLITIFITLFTFLLFTGCEEKKNYTITYVMDVVEEEMFNVNYTEKNIELLNPTKKGYIFSGWYEDEYYTTKVESIEMIDGGKKALYAKWEVENPANFITSYELREKLNSGDTFVLVIGSNACYHCKIFTATIRRYVYSGHTVYYLDLNDRTDTGLRLIDLEIEERLLDDIPEDRGITSLATPTSVYVKDGEFVDAVQGAYGMDGGRDYEVWCDVMEGKYVGKTTYSIG